MALSTTVTQEINGLYVALYNRAADGPALDYWVSVLAAHDPAINLGNASTTQISAADAQFLGQQFVSTQSTYFTSQYGALNDLQYVQALYVNIGGNTGDPVGVQYWFSQLQQLEANGVSQTTARADVAGLFVQNLIGIDLTVGATALNLSASQYAAAEARQQQLLNKVAVSQYYADESRLPGGSILDSTSTSSQAFQAAIAAIASVTNDPGTVATAEAAILAAVQQASLTPILNLTFALNTYTLTAGADVITELSGMGHDVINAPLVIGPLGLQSQSLSVGDSVNVSGPGNVANLTLGGTIGAFWPAGTTFSGVETINFQNVGNILPIPGLLPALIPGNDISGMTTANMVNSAASVLIGGGFLPIGTTGLPTLLTTVGMTNTGVQTFALQIQNAVLAAATAPALTVNLNGGVGTNYNPIGSPATYTYIQLGGEAVTQDGALVVGPDVFGGAGYTSMTFNVTGNNAIQLGTFGSNALTSVKIAGTGSLLLDGTTGIEGSAVTTITSTATGPVIITGAAGETAIPASLPLIIGAGNTGFLTSNTALTAVTTGAGNDWVDISSMSLAQIIANGLTVNLGAGTNELVVQQSVADTTTPLAFYSNVQILGVDSGGTMDMKNLPGITEVQLIGNSTVTSDLTIKDGANNFTVDLGDAFNNAIPDHNMTINSSLAGVSPSTWTLNVAVGEAGPGGGELADVGTLSISGYQNVNLVSNSPFASGTGNYNYFGHNVTVPLTGLMISNLPGGSVNLAISGTGDLWFGPESVASFDTFKGTQFGIAGSTVALNLLGNGTSLVDNGANVLVINGDVNAGNIDAHLSNGLFMGGLDISIADANIGDSIMGSSKFANYLQGSLGNDTAVMGQGNILHGPQIGDYYATNGGGDSISQPAVHQPSTILLGVDTIAGAITANSTVGEAVSYVDGSGKYQSYTTAAVDDLGQAGFWSVNPQGPNFFTTKTPGSALIDLSHSATFGTSADQSTISNFNATTGGDTLQFSVSEWAGGAAGLWKISNGASSTIAAGTTDKIQLIDSGGLIGSGPDAGATLTILNNALFSNAAAVATALQSDAYSIGIDHAFTWTAGVASDQLIGYEDAKGNFHIADMNLVGNGTSGDVGLGTTVHISDMVQLTGVSIAQVAADPGLIHFIA